MDLISSLEVRTPLMAAIIGSGGKTSLMYALAVGHTRLGLRVATTTTTKIFIPKRHESPAVVLADDFPALLDKVQSALAVHPQVTAARGVIEGGKLKGLTPMEADRLYESGAADLVLVEADGARGLPVKAPGPDEPVIPRLTCLVVLVVGLGGLGARLDENTVFRPDLFAELGGLAPGSAITAESLVRTAFHERGPFRGAPARARRMVFLNQADRVAPAAAAQAARLFMKAGAGRIERVVWGSLMDHPSGFQAVTAPAEREES